MKLIGQNRSLIKSDWFRDCGKANKFYVVVMLCKIHRSKVKKENELACRIIFHSRNRILCFSIYQKKKKMKKVVSMSEPKTLILNGLPSFKNQQKAFSIKTRNSYIQLYVTMSLDIYLYHCHEWLISLRGYN